MGANVAMKPCKKVGVWGQSNQLAIDDTLRKTLIATALNVSFRLFASSFNAVAAQPVTSAGVGGGFGVEGPESALGAAEPPAPRAGPCSLCRPSTSGGCPVAHHRPYPWRAQAAGNHVLNQARICLSRSPQASSWEIGSPAQSPKPLQAHAAPANPCHGRAVPWPGEACVPSPRTNRLAVMSRAAPASQTFKCIGPGCWPGTNSLRLVFLVPEEEVFGPSAALARGEVRPDPPYRPSRPAPALAPRLRGLAGHHLSTRPLPRHGLERAQRFCPRTGNSPYPPHSQPRSRTPRLPRPSRRDLDRLADQAEAYLDSPLSKGE